MISVRSSAPTAPTASAPLALGLTEARTTVAAAEQTGRVICCANAHRALAKLLSATGRELDAATAARRALTLDEAKGNLVGVAETRRHFDSRALDPS